ncbi:MAG: energy-coupling factor ABC transporter ATP-binding protein [Ignavibacteriales bacterium]
MEPVLRAVNLRFAYPTGVVALDGVDLGLRAGETVAVVGQNGSGKTTLFKVIAGLLGPYSGHIEIGGRDTSTMTVSQISRVAALVLQNPDVQLFSQTVREEIGFGPRNSGLDRRRVAERTAEAIGLVGLRGRENEFPMSLSRGDRMRVVIAAALAMKPSILMLDEPTTGLDYRGLRDLASIMRHYASAGGAVLIATHNTETVAENAQRIVVLDSGAVKVNGPTRWLMSRPGLLKQIGMIPPQVVRLDREVLDGQDTALTVEELASKVEEEYVRSELRRIRKGVS